MGWKVEISKNRSGGITGIECFKRLEDAFEAILSANNLDYKDFHLTFIEVEPCVNCMHIKEVGNKCVVCMS